MRDIYELSKILFQFLIGRLGTVVKLLGLLGTTLFQFLIGRLGTSI